MSGAHDRAGGSGVMPRVLLVAATTGYQVRSFTDAAARLGVDLRFATDRCHVLDDPWQDRAIPIRFHDEDVAVRAITAASVDRPVDGVLAVGDRAGGDRRRRGTRAAAQGAFAGRGPDLCEQTVNPREATRG